MASSRSFVGFKEESVNRRGAEIRRGLIGPLYRSVDFLCILRDSALSTILIIDRKDHHFIVWCDITETLCLLAF